MNRKQQLIDCFDTAIKCHQEYMAVKIQTPNKNNEVIIFKRDNFIYKRDYYINNYDDKLRLIRNRKVKIVDFCCANSLEEVECDLLNE